MTGAWFIGDPATVMNEQIQPKPQVVWPGVRESNGLRLRWFEVKTIVQKQVVNSQSAWLDWSYLSCKCQGICPYIQLGVISILVNGYNSTSAPSVRNEPNNIYYWWNEQNKKERAKNRTLWDVSEWGITRGRWQINLNKRWTVCQVQYEWIQLWTLPDKPNVCSSL